MKRLAILRSLPPGPTGFSRDRQSSLTQIRLPTPDIQFQKAKVRECWTRRVPLGRSFGSRPPRLRISRTRSSAW